MAGFVIRILIVAVGLWIAAALIPGISADGMGPLLLAALALGIINALVRPLVVLLTFPVTLLTLGLFLLVINAGMLNLADWFVDGFHVDGFFSALFGAIIVSLVSWAGSAWIGSNGKYEVLVVKR